MRRGRAWLRDDAVDPLGARCPDPERCRHDRLQRERERREHSNGSAARQWRAEGGRGSSAGSRESERVEGEARSDAKMRRASPKFTRRRLSWQARAGKATEPRRKRRQDSDAAGGSDARTGKPPFYAFRPGGSGAHGGRRGEGRHQACRAGGRPDRDASRDARAHSRPERATQGRRAGRRPHRGDPGGQADLGAHPAVSPAGAHQGRRRLRSDVAAGRGRDRSDGRNRSARREWKWRR